MCSSLLIRLPMSPRHPPLQWVAAAAYAKSRTTPSRSSVANEQGKGLSKPLKCFLLCCPAPAAFARCKRTLTHSPALLPHTPATHEQGSPRVGCYSTSSTASFVFGNCLQGSVPANQVSTAHLPEAAPRLIINSSVIDHSSGSASHREIERTTVLPWHQPSPL